MTPCGSTDSTNAHVNILHLSSGQKIKVTGFLEPWHNRTARCHKLKTTKVCSIPGRGIRIFVCQKRPGRLWEPHSHLQNGFRLCFPWGKAAENFIGQLLPSNVEVKNEWNYIISSRKSSDRTVYKNGACIYVSRCVCVCVCVCIYIYIYMALNIFM